MFCVGENTDAGGVVVVEGKGLSAGAIAGIVVGVLVALIVIIIIVLVLLVRYSKSIGTYYDRSQDDRTESKT